MGASGLLGGGAVVAIGFDEERARFCMENMVRPAARPAGPVTGADRGVGNDDRGVLDGRLHRRGIFGPKSLSDAEGTQERS